MLCEKSIQALVSMRKKDIHICNLVVTACFIANFNLYSFARLVGGTYRPSKFAAVRFRLKIPKCTMLVFASGKCVCIGCMSVGEAEIAINTCFRYVCKIARSAKLSDISVQNIVSHTNIKHRVNLIKMSQENSLNINYDPELFPGLRMSLQEQNARACIFFQGNIVVTGCKSFETLARVWSIVQQRIEPYIQQSSEIDKEACNSDCVFSAKTHNHLSHNATSMSRQLDRLMYDSDIEMCE
eukprot:gene9652-11436_t